jgi:hypothetical protein
MNPKLSRLLWPVIVAAVLLATSACTHNSLYRTEAAQDCHGNTCDKAFIEHHHNADENYDLAFVEFSERGNVFDRDKMKQVIDYVDQQEQASPNGIMLVVFTHGWRHNAGNTPKNNVHGFRNMLKMVSAEQLGRKKVIGIYIGWRGLSLKLDPVNLATYWGRKNTARQVGNSGVPELLLRLNEIAKRGYANNRNTFVITGHSFGAAVILAALKDILLERIVTAPTVNPDQCGGQVQCPTGCYKSEPFATTTFLINPAVEANELLQLKEVIAEKRCFAKSQPKLLHIISSDRDLPTRFAFVGGQFLGVSMLENEASLHRKIYIGDTPRQKDVSIPESGLDTTTVGNYPPFRTGRTREADKLTAQYRKEHCPDAVANQCYIPCHGTDDCLTDAEKKRFPYHLPVAPHEPVSIIYGDRDFMSGHNDIFNDEVMGYIAAAVIENQYESSKTGIAPEVLDKCQEWNKERGRNDFSFTACRTYFHNKYLVGLSQQKTASK